MTKKRSALGKGLGALIDDNTSSYQKRSVEEAISSGAVAEIPVEQIQVNPFQPRTEFDIESLQELSDSIKELGIIQPLTLKKVADNQFQLISGERRLRASKMAGLQTVIAYIRDANDQEMLEMALVENIQREELNPIEIALSYNRLMDECQLTQEQLSKRVSKGRTTVTNFLRLLKLPDLVQAGVRDKKITMGHARALIGIDNPQTQNELFERIVREALSVRKVEQLVREINYPVPEEKKEAIKKINLTDDDLALKETLASTFKTKVDVKKNAEGKGSITISFDNAQEYQRIAEMLKK